MSAHPLSRLLTPFLRLMVLTALVCLVSVRSALAASVMFQYGVSSYTGTEDATILSDLPTTNTGGGTTVGVDGSPLRQTLTVFRDVFGGSAGQVSLGSTINTATLTLSIFDSSSDAVNLHRMLGDWTEATATWNNLLLNGNLLLGVQADDLEAVAAASASFTASVNNVFKDIDVTADLQAWSNGAANNGWGFLPTGTDQVAWESSESANPGHRPELTVDFTAVVIPLPSAAWMGMVGLGLVIVLAIIRGKWSVGGRVLPGRVTSGSQQAHIDPPNTIRGPGVCTPPLFLAIFGRN